MHYIVYSDCTAVRTRLRGEAITTKNLTKFLLLTVLIFAGCGGDDDETTYECILLQPNQETHRLRDFQFARYRFFDLGVIGGIDYIQPGDTLRSLYVYQSAGLLDPELPPGVAYPNSFAPTSSPDSVVERFRPLGIGNDWEVLSDSDSGTFTLVFPRPLQNIESTTIAYYMEVRKADGSHLSFGNLGKIPFRLQIVKFAHPNPSDPLWDAEWRSVYDLGKRNLNWRGLDISIYRSEFGEEAELYSLSREGGTSYLTILGLDLDSTWYGDIGDGQVDNSRAILWLQEGLLIFPSRTPFSNPALIEPVTAIYSADNVGDWVGTSKYHLTIRTTGIGRSIRLPRINVVENSEQLELNGRRLSRSVHYNIDYAVGEVEFTDELYLGAEDVVSICYEYLSQ